MQNQKIKNKIYVNILLSVLIGAISYFFIYPQYVGQGTFYSPENNISSLLKEKSDYESAMTIAKNYDNKIVKINNDYNDALQKLPIETLNKILPSSVDPVITIYQLTKIASMQGSDMLLTEPKFSDDGTSGSNDLNKKFNTLKIDFNVKGSYENIKFFLKNLENSERIFNVTSLNFSSTPNKDM